MSTPSIQDRFTPENSFVVLVDHQTGTIGWVYSLPTATVITSCRVLARMAVEYSMPLLLTTIPDIQEVASQAFAGRFKRGGQLSCFDEPTLREAARATGRKKMILAGLTTDICLFWAATSAVALGFEVQVVADACGTMTPLGDQVTFDRLRGMGVVVTVTNQLVTELVDNFGTPEGQKAQTIMGEEIISKLGK